MILDGKKFQENIISKKSEEIKKLNISNCIITVNTNDIGTEIYTKGKISFFEKMNVKTKYIKLPYNTQEKELLDLIENLNNDNTITGILVQLPVPKHINSNKIALAINKDKDLDCFNPYNIGNMFLGNMEYGKDILPATPMGILLLLDYYNISIQSKNVVIVGRSNIVGKPLASMLTNKNATVTLCHSYTTNLHQKLKNADIIVLAVGQKNFITQDMVNKNAVIIDVGINRLEGKKICGDFSIKKEDYINYAAPITPVPNGVGRCTTTALIFNTLACYNRQKQKR